MDESQKQLIFELSKKYVFETFDFKSKSPEELLKYYQETSEKISKVIEDQNTKLAEENAKILSNLNW
ncbi:hypothetical protein [Clostridium botulinum]|uniref:Uncharacterized protein n=1 Tax=Clostridium botulinum TaxID=1491 RepID=A0A6G4H4P7_CLOBO|nr:hypothetical protein [Clostridium botulinum]ABS35412.1 hypothetical protein CLB_2474 [Clostridium botulinum A str. ATCC 19397]MBO3437613.1 hypothetical protein [Clostridium botulinum]MBY6842226.1 hypothetical protein [Clostridium botulinum]MBY6844469.1 hypothetical protein [Clostridium botulinum]MBY6952190.1 hypothetical protein [Clostridium botulinum]